MTKVRNILLKYERLILISLFILIALFTTVDIIADLDEQLPLEHFVHELGLLALALVAITYQILLIWDRDRKIKSISVQIKELEAEKQEFRDRFSKVKSEFSDIIDQQFNSWQLSTVEKDIALLLIKGLSMKEIAATRHTTEGTVRQQAAAIYKKSGLSGRQELAAIFLDELFS